MVLSLITAGGGIAADAPLVLQASSPWAVNLAKDACHLARSFGEGDDKITIDFRQYGPGQSFTLLALGKSLVHGKPGSLVTEFGPNGTPHEDRAARMMKRDGGQGLVETITRLVPEPVDEITRGKKSRDWQPDAEDTAPLPYDREAEGRITELRLSGSISRDVVLELGRMDLPMDAMRVCLDDLMVRWGVDPVAYHSLSRRAVPSGNPGLWAIPSDYPPRMLRDGMVGAVHFRLMVDETGKPIDCIVQSAVGDEFDKVTCQIMLRRARFTPARDAAGRPVASFYVNTVRWSIP